MTAQVLKLLHIEDDAAQQLLIGHFLESVPDYSFQIVNVDNESAALEEFEKGGVDLIILDYQLAEGDGLSCLREIRRRDPLVPVVVVSGAASPEITAELLRFGADDYLSKHDLSSALLSESVVTSFRRASEWRARQMA